MEKKVMSTMTKGLIIGLILIILSALQQVLVTDFAQIQKYRWVSYLIIIGSIAWASYSYGKDMDGNVTFGSVFTHGFKTTALVTLIILAYTVLSLTVIFPEMKEKGIEIARQQMESDGKLNEEQIDQALDMTRKFFFPFVIGGVLFGTIVLGAIGALIGASIAKKNPNPQPFDQTDINKI